MNLEEATAIYRSGEDTTVKTLMSLSATIEKFQKHPLDSTDHPSTPSGMKAAYKKPPKIRRSSKSPGQKKGHPGTRRAQPDVIHHSVEHHANTCPDCNAKLADPVAKRVRLIEELPPVQPEVTQHTIHRYWCAQCKRIVEPRVADALPGATIGLKTMIHTAWLHYGLGMTIDKIVELVSVSANFRVTASGLVHGWRNLALLLMPLYQQIGKLARNSTVLHADETSWRVGGKTHWLWCFTNKQLVYFVIDRCRGSPVVKKVLGILFRGTLITDFFGAYNKLVAFHKQACLAHLFRELVKVDLIHSSAGWTRFRKKLKRFLKDALRLDQKEGKISRKKFDRMKRRLHERLNDLATTSYADKHANRIAKRLRRHQKAILTFLDNPEVAPDNNHAERVIRNGVIMRKNSYCNRSQQGAETQGEMMSIFGTLHLRGLNPVEALLAIAKTAIRTGKPAAFPE